MLQGWNPLVETWSSSQMDQYLEWSSTTEPPTASDFSGPTDYASPNTTVPAVETTTFAPGENNVITTNDPTGVFPERNIPSLDEVMANIYARTGEGLGLPDPPTFEPPTRGEGVTAEGFGETPGEPMFNVDMLPGGSDQLPGTIELQPMEPVNVEPFTQGEIHSFGPASAWEMPTPQPGSIVADLADPLHVEPEFDLAELQKVVPAAELQSALQNSLVDVDAFGSGSYDMGSLMGDIGGAAIGLGVINPLLTNLKKNYGEFGEVTSDAVMIAGALNMIMSVDVVGLGVSALYDCPSFRPTNGTN